MMPAIEIERITKEREQNLLAAHAVGRAYAANVIATSRNYNDAGLEEVFLAAVAGEIRRHLRKT